MEYIYYNISMELKMSEKFYKLRKYYGYDVINNKYCVNEEKAEIVKYIFKLYLQEKNLNIVYKILNEKNIKTINNKKWKDTSVILILENEVYLGKRYLKLGKDKILLENSHEAIIDNDTFEKAQELLKIRKERMKNNYPLKSFFRCNTCKSGYSRVRQDFICGTRIKTGKRNCSENVKIPITELENICIGLIRFYNTYSDVKVDEKLTSMKKIAHNGTIITKDEKLKYIIFQMKEEEKIKWIQYKENGNEGIYAEIR